MSQDPYLYSGTHVLRNKPGIRDHVQLQALEYLETAACTGEAIDYAHKHRRLDEQCWRGIHRILFANIYDWAGKLRTVEMSKGTSVFAPVMALRGYADREILPKFKTAARQAGDDDNLFIAALAECWGELNFLHPFREGNGRSTQIFIAALAHRSGRQIEWSRIDKAMEIASAIAAGAKDYQGYERLLKRAIERVE